MPPQNSYFIAGRRFAVFRNYFEKKLISKYIILNAPKSKKPPGIPDGLSFMFTVMISR